jgi:hypothetical protein
LGRFYDGVLFFVDLVHHLNTKENILKWLELYSRESGVNIFKIPIKIIATKSHMLIGKELEEEKCKIEKEIAEILDASC